MPTVLEIAMKKTALTFAFILFSSFCFAEDTQPQLVLDKIGFKVTARHWVTTESALVNVAIDATLTNIDLVQARAQIMDKLNKIANSEWHLLQFERSQDNSGLEKLSVKARSRVAENILPDVYKKAQSVSKPGMSYKIDSIEFKPSLEEIQQVKNKLRKTLYNQANQELSRINKVYSRQNYSLYNVVFADDGTLPQPAGYKARDTMNVMAMSAVSSDLSVSNELIMSAIVEVASNRKPGS
jgi:hypothetical protein